MTSSSTIVLTVIVSFFSTTMLATTTAAFPHPRLEAELRALDELDLPGMVDMAKEMSSYQEDHQQQSPPPLPFTMEDELQLVDDLGAMVDEVELYGLGQGQGQQEQRGKRFTVDFNGMQVSYPTYVRLTRLQDKVLKLQRTIQLLHRRYPEDQLVHLPQYQRLMSLYNSLKPLLPTADGGGAGAILSGGEEPQGGQGQQAGDTVVSLAAEEENDVSPYDGDGKKKRAFTVEFMGMRVSYPQYLRLVALQEKVVKLDQVMRRMRSKVPIEQLELIPKWNNLVTLHESLKKLLPPGYAQQAEDARMEGDLDGLMGGGRGQETMMQDMQGMISLDDNDDSSRRRRRRKRAATTKFNDVQVSIPEYGRLMNMQRSALKLDRLMRKMAREMDRDRLQASPQWHRLVELRRSLQRLMPEGHPEFLDHHQQQVDQTLAALGEEEQDEFLGGLSKRTITMDFNGVRVSYPEYVRLTALQKKVQKLDAVMERLRQVKGQANLETLPQWHRLVQLRKALVNLQPMMMTQATTTAEQQEEVKK